MAKENRHPYVPGTGILNKTFAQLRKKFPTQLDSGVMKKLGLAPNNESVVIATLKFLGFLDENGAKTAAADTVFLKHKDEEFQKELEKVIKKSYVELFELRGDDMWSLDRDGLIGFFRGADNTSELTAQRQAIAFETLAQLAGHTMVSSTGTSQTKQVKSGRSPKLKKESDKNKDSKSSSVRIPELKQPNVGLTVRIEINLPAQADKDTYDRIFASIRKNLINE